jgi:hypothetical protein
MATPDNVPQPADEERSMTKRMLALIHRFDAEERRSGTESADGSSPRRRRDDEPTPTSRSADDLIVEPAQPE